MLFFAELVVVDAVLEDSEISSLYDASVWLSLFKALSTLSIEALYWSISSMCFGGSSQCCSSHIAPAKTFVVALPSRKCDRADSIRSQNALLDESDALATSVASLQLIL